MSDLVKRLREEADDTQKNWYRVATDEQREICRALTIEAADRIAALESENKRLREQLATELVYGPTVENKGDVTLCKPYAQEYGK